MVYQGSKKLYTKYIVPILQKTIDENKVEVFYDGMVGGGYIIEQIQAPNKYGLDLNSDLIDLYNYGLANIGNESAWPDTITRADWDSAKRGDGESWWRALVCFFASYSARGWSGGFCMNSDRDYYHERLRNFQNQLPKITDVIFETADVNTYNFKPNSVIYLDPPYKNTKKYDINKKFDYEQFWDTARRLSKDNKVFVSEQVAPDDFEAIWTLETNRNCFGSGLKKATENLFIYRG